jgi:hypothetical protein
MNKDNQNNQSNNKEDNEIKYEIRSMENDLKNSEYKKGSFSKNEESSHSQQEDKKAQEEERRAQEERQKKREEEAKQNKKNQPNPFLENIKKDEKNIFTNTEEEKKGKKQPSSNSEQQTQKQKSASLQKTTMKQENSQKPPLLFLIFLITTSLVTAGAGFYYYFFVLNQEESEKTVVEKQPQENQNPEEVKKNKNNEKEVVEQQEIALPEKLTDPDKIIALNQEETLVKKIQSIQNITKNPKIYRFKKEEDFLSSQDFLSAFSIQIDQEVVNNLGSSWVMMHKTEGNQTRSAVIFEIKAENKESTQTAFKEMETSLPEALSPIHQEINQISTSIPENPQFQNSMVSKNFRYFNFNPNDETVSIDWGIINENLLVISTSKSTTEAVTKILNQKSSSENTKDAKVSSDKENSPEQKSQQEGNNQ